MVSGNCRSPFTIYDIPASAEDLDNFLHGADEAVHLPLRVVEGEGGARGRGHAEVLHDGLRAVVAGAYGYALLVEYRAHVVRVHVAHDEREHARLLARCPDDAHALDGRNPLGRVPEKLMLVRLRGGAVERVQVVDGRAQTYLRGYRGRARLELVGYGRVRAALERHGAYH